MVDVEVRAQGVATQPVRGDGAASSSGEVDADRTLSGNGGHRGVAIGLVLLGTLGAVGVLGDLRTTSTRRTPPPTKSELSYRHLRIGGRADTPTTTGPAVEHIRAATPPAEDAAISTFVADAEGSGIVPGPGWSWTIGATDGQCGISAKPDQGTGCTSWSSGKEVTVFEGSVTLALVAHEIANAETEAYAVPTLLGNVFTASGGTSWSPTDAVATCLVEHFLGIQDGAAGPWQCPAPLASTVAAHIHDTVVTTRTTASCGVASGRSSTLTFAAGAGTLTVTSPTTGSVPQTATSGSFVVVSGIGTFTAVDVGGTTVVGGVCQA